MTGRQRRQSGAKAEGLNLSFFFFDDQKNGLFRSRQGVSLFFYFEDQKKNEIFKGRGGRNALRVPPLSPLVTLLLADQTSLCRFSR